MAPSRRDFLRTSACALGGMALASTVDSLGLIHAMTPQAATSYKALVCIFLNGGNDGNNLLVSLDQYSSYASGRGVDLAIPSASLLPVSPLSGGSYGFHPQMPEIRDLFNQNRCAVVTNVGPLVEPLTKTTYQNGTGKKPLQLFSHSDQIGLFQTGVANEVLQTGWGGRVADLIVPLNGAASFPQNISIAGVNLLLTGVNTRQLAIGDSNTALNAVLPLNSPPGSSGFTAAQNTARRLSFDQMRGMDLGIQLVKAASDTRTSSLQTSAALASVNPVLVTAFPNTSLGRQLLQVARVIKASTDPTAGINMKRQIFFCQLGGFDTHSGQKVINNGQPGGQDGLLLQVSQAMKAFYDATVELGLQNDVTSFTLSDFSRTLQPAGTGAQAGSDHAWGNNHLVVGGSVLGRTIYGTYPTLQLGGPNDTDSGTSPRGRWIPTTSVEQFAATLANWYGLSSTDVAGVFPLIGRFASPNLGFMS
jgi:uncharacterized protein (DUF1501 family)